MFFAGFIIISSAVRLRWDNPSIVVKKAFILYKKKTPPPEYRSDDGAVA